MRYNASRHPDKRETQVNAKARLVSILYGCTAQRLAQFTAEGLAATHNCDVRVCEYELTIARQKRGGL